MIARCREAGLDAPDFRQDGDMFIQIIRRSVLRKTAQVTAQDNELSNKELSDLAAAFGLPATQVTAQVAAQVTAQVAAQVVKLLQAAVDPVDRNLLQQASKLGHREHFRKNYLEPLISSGWLERTISDKPTSPKQRYRLTETGRAWLEKMANKTG